jgi:hypothetical protein
MSAPHPTRRPRTRPETPFTWYVTCGMPTYTTLANVRFDRTFREIDAIVEAYTVGEPKARALFGPDVRYGGPAWAGISYGHVNCLGSTLRFPHDSEVAHTPIYGSLDEGIEALQQGIDWASAGLMPFYIALWEQLKRTFPDLHIGFGGFGYEGPITTAWEVRGHAFFADTYDQPEQYCAFMQLLTRSIVDYAVFVRALNGQPARVDRVSLYDDVSSLIHPRRWPDLVLPYHEQFFLGQETGSARRHAHIENLVRDHLPYLDTLGLDSFDPSVSPRLTPTDLSAQCHVPFLWRLNEMHVRDRTPDQIRQFVFGAVANGASGVFCTLSRTMTGAEQVSKVHAFIEAAKQVERLMADRIPRDQLTNYA